MGTYLKSVGVPISCLVSFALPFFPFSFVLFFVGVVPLPTANGRDGALTPKISDLNIILRLLFYKEILEQKIGSISSLQTSKTCYRNSNLLIF